MILMKLNLIFDVDFVLLILQVFVLLLFGIIENFRYTESDKIVSTLFFTLWWIPWYSKVVLSCFGLLVGLWQYNIISYLFFITLPKNDFYYEKKRCVIKWRTSPNRAGVVEPRFHLLAFLFTAKDVAAKANLSNTIYLLCSFVYPLFNPAVLFCFIPYPHYHQLYLLCLPPQ